MFCIRCMRSMLSPTTRSSSLLTTSQLAKTSPTTTSPFRRTFTLLTTQPTRPKIPQYRPSASVGSTDPAGALVSETPTSSSFVAAAPPQSIQSRGPKRDTFNPSHLVRKRRHGFLSRVRTRTGRKILVRRKLKGRRYLSH